jgi:inner membrane protein
VAGVACSVIPDLDVIGFHFGVHYSDFWGHRGFTHSLLFAVLLASAIAVVMSWHGTSGIGRFALFGYLFLATASHGLLDSITNGGLGVAFFSPFNNSRYFLPWRPVRVSPIAVTRFFTPRGLAIIQSEFVWIWLPAILFAAMVLTLRRMSRPDVASS